MRWLALLLFAGCVPPVAPLPITPAAPVLDPVSVEQHRRLFNLRGVVATETAVRLFTDTACAGPLYRQVTAVEFAKGVPVELVGGADNVFSANAVSSLGATSACSAPVRVRYAPLPRPGRPSVASHPDSPSWQTHFTIAGASDLSARVRLHDVTCANPVLGELSAADFFSPGFPVDVPVNGSRQFAIDALNEDQTSDCGLITVTNDRMPPVVTARLGSPTPSPQQRSWVVVEGDMAFFSVMADPSCTGTSLQTCFSCNLLDVEFPPDASTSWGVSATDLAGNSTCVSGDRPWVHNPSLPQDEAMVLLPPVMSGGFLLLPRALVPVVERVEVQVFRSEDCSGPVQLVQSAYQVISSGIGLRLDSPAGFITARTLRLDGGVDPCSNAVLWQP